MQNNSMTHRENYFYLYNLNTLFLQDACEGSCCRTSYIEFTEQEGKGIKLINFELEHVPLYEEWYKDKQLLGRYSDATLFCVELTATEPMDHDSLVTSQAMYAYDDDSYIYEFG